MASIGSSPMECKLNDQFDEGIIDSFEGHPDESEAPKGPPINSMFIFPKRLINYKIRELQFRQCRNSPGCFY